MLVRHLYERSPDDGRTWTRVASFELTADETVVSTYFNSPIARLFESGAGAVTTMRGMVLTPADGRAFYDRLPVCFSRSTMYAVRDE